MLLSFARLIDSLTQLPVEDLVMLVALAGLGIAAFAIYAVHSIAKGRERR